MHRVIGNSTVDGNYAYKNQKINGQETDERLGAILLTMNLSCCKYMLVRPSRARRQSIGNARRYALATGKPKSMRLWI